MHVMDTSPRRLLLGRVTMGLWPPVEAEFGMGKREVYFGSARTRSSPEGALPEGWGAETFSRLCLQGARAEPPPAGRHGVGVAGRPPKSLSSLSLGQISLSQVQSPNGLMCRNPAHHPRICPRTTLLSLSQGPSPHPGIQGPGFGGSPPILHSVPTPRYTFLPSPLSPTLCHPVLPPNLYTGRSSPNPSLTTPLMPPAHRLVPG